MKVVLLGTGSPEGMPIMLCDCEWCSKTKPRTRPGLLISDKKTNILFDASIDIRQQILTSKISKLDATFLTHAHFDHVWWIGDLAQLMWVGKNTFPIYANKKLFSFINENYGWIDLPFKEFEDNLTIDNLKIESVPIDHSPWATMHGFIIRSNGKKVGYIPDVKDLSATSKSKFSNCDILIADGQYILGKYIADDDHAGGPQLVKLLESLNAKEIYLVAFSEHWYKMSASQAQKKLPSNFKIVNDGHSINI